MCVCVCKGSVELCCSEEKCLALSMNIHHEFAMKREKGGE